MNEVIIAGLIAFLTAVIAALWNSRLARKAELDKELRVALAALTKALSASVHAMAWLTWNARYNPKVLTAADISKYNETINSLFTDLVGFRVIVAALSENLHDDMTPLVERLYVLDRKVAIATTLFRDSPEASTKALASYLDEVNKFDNEILKRVTELIRLERTKKR